MCREILASNFCLLRGHKTSLTKGIYSILNFSKVSAFCQIREALRRLFSESAGSHLPPTQNNCYVKVMYFRVADSDLLWLSLFGPDLEAGGH